LDVGVLQVSAVNECRMWKHKGYIWSRIQGICSHRALSNRSKGIASREAGIRLKQRIRHVSVDRYLGSERSLVGGGIGGDAIGLVVKYAIAAAQTGPTVPRQVQCKSHSRSEVFPSGVIAPVRHPRIARI